MRKITKVMLLKSIEDLKSKRKIFNDELNICGAGDLGILWLNNTVYHIDGLLDQYSELVNMMGDRDV